MKVLDEQQAMTPGEVMAVVFGPPMAPAQSPRPGPMDERTLCQRAMCGEMSAWNALVQKHNHRVVVSLLARGVRLDRARDIAQDAWLRLIEQQREGKISHLSLPGIAVAQAAFLALAAARKTARASTVAVEDDGAQLADPRADTEARLLAEERIARAEAILARCSPSAREVFRLAYSGEGLSHARIADALGLSLQRVRQIVCEVRKRLREELEGAGEP